MYLPIQANFTANSKRTRSHKYTKFCIIKLTSSLHRSTTCNITFNAVACFIFAVHDICTKVSTIPTTSHISHTHISGHEFSRQTCNEIRMNVRWMLTRWFVGGLWCKNFLSPVSVYFSLFWCVSMFLNCIWCIRLSLAFRACEWQRCAELSERLLEHGWRCSRWIRAFSMWRLSGKRLWRVRKWVLDIFCLYCSILFSNYLWINFNISNNIIFSN